MANENVECLMLDSLSPGYRFEPTDEELILYSLIPKNMDQTLDQPNMIWDLSLSDYSPEEIAEKYKPKGDGVWYFFTPITRKFENGTRRNRVAGDGYWRSVNKKDVYSNGMQIGFKTLLTFHRLGTPAVKGEKTDWIIHEFTLPLDPKRKRTDEENNHFKLGDHALCQMYKNTKRGPKGHHRSNKASRTSQENEEVQNQPHEVAPALDTQQGCDEIPLISPVKDAASTVLLRIPDDHPTVQQAASYGSFHGIGSVNQSNNEATLSGNFSSTNGAENALGVLSSNTFGAVSGARDQPLRSISPDRFSFPRQTNDDDDHVGHMLSTFVDPPDPPDLSFLPVTETSSSIDFEP